MHNEKEILKRFIILNHKRQSLNPLELSEEKLKKYINNFKSEKNDAMSLLVYLLANEVTVTFSKGNEVVFTADIGEENKQIIENITGIHPDYDVELMVELSDILYTGKQLRSQIEKKIGKLIEETGSRGFNQVLGDYNYAKSITTDKIGEISKQFVEKCGVDEDVSKTLTEIFILSHI